MPFTELSIQGLFLFEPQFFIDERGYFFESFNKKVFEEAGIIANFVQDNQSCSGYGVLRGLHYQLEPFAQAKLLRVLKGEILDVAVDIRKNSPSFGQWESVILSEENNKQLFIPRGFAHGFVVKSKEAVMLYKCDNFYSKEHDAGIAFNDPSLNIDWETGDEKIILSEKDKKLPPLNQAVINF